MRQQLVSLEPLRPLPISQDLRAAAEASTEWQQEGSRKTRMRAYSSTGGATIASNVGRFQIVDRSRHGSRRSRLHQHIFLRT